MDPLQQISRNIKEYALELGFSHVGICPVDPGERVPHFEEWLQRDLHGEMKYLENPGRVTPHESFDGIRSIVVVGLNYYNAQTDTQEAIISKYAWGGEYHRIMKPMLEQLAAYVRSQSPNRWGKAYVDTGPVAEKYWAQKAGLGWVGKHTNVISKRGSSWFFLGVVLTDLGLPGDIPATDRCGSCARCIDVCPTGAIIAPYVLDARLCISYLTIELRGSIPRDLRPMIGNRIFGCDDCQDVCPWNRFAFAGDPRFAPRQEVFTSKLADYLQLTPELFMERFRGTNVLRAKYRGFIRNCLVAAGNSRRQELRSSIKRHLAADDEVIREHAVWALAQFSNDDTWRTLSELLLNEPSSLVKEEIQYWLGTK